VKFYSRYPGDINIKTGHLDPAEFGCYDRLLDHYYATEAPIPADGAYSICRAVKAEHRRACDKVLAQFFELTEAGWRSEEVEAALEAERRKQAALRDLQGRDEYRRYRAIVFERDGEMCAYCGAVDVPLQLDHVVPRSRGGSDQPFNLTPACRPCNSSKGARTPQEWLQ
jgi:uncharacterized protein YdaU (DUF1376 family)